MKNLIVLALLVLILTPAIAQEKEKNYFDSKHQICLGVMNMFGNADMDVYPYPWPYIYYPIDFWVYPYSSHQRTPGLSYKYHFEKFALRASVHFNYSDENIDQTTYKNETSRMYLQSALGFEFKKNFERSYLFYGMDIYNRVNTYNYLYVEKEGDYKNSNERTEIAYGVSPLIGFNYFITPKLSLSTEAKLFAEMYEEKWKDQYGDNDPTESKYDGINLKLAPLGQVSINIHL